jgi:hypothetical protein
MKINDTEGVENIESLETIESSIDTPIESFKIPSLSIEQLDKLNNIERLIYLKEKILTSERVDKGICLEAFAAMGEEKSIEIGKLTSTPSFLNKEVIEKVITEYDYVNDTVYSISDIYEDRDNLLTIKDTAVKCKDEISIFYQHCSELIKSIESEGRVLIIYEGKTYDLLHDSIKDLETIDDGKIYFPAFKGKLSNLIWDILNYLDANKWETDFNIITLIKNIKQCERNIDRLIAYIDKVTEFNLAKIEILEIIAALKELNEYTETLEFVNKWYIDSFRDKNMLSVIIEYLELLKKSQHT